jgi:hypothetical protein
MKTDSVLRRETTSTRVWCSSIKHWAVVGNRQK